MHLRVRLYVILGLGIALAAAAPAEAQRRTRVPDTGVIGIGASIGATVPTNDLFDNGLEVAGNIEGYLTPRVSVRGQAGTTWWDVATPRDRTMQPLFALANLVYNWEGGEWHPYVTGGFGVYHFRLKDPRGNVSDTDAGFDVGGGLEYFLGPGTTITGEVLYHHIPNVQTSLLPTEDGSFWSIAMGLKTYVGR